MALATRCPNCNALFRVAAEQLRSRGGMVRCGSCRRVFNAIAGLDYLDAERLAGEDTGPGRGAPPPATGAATAAPVARATPRSTPGTLPPISADASAARLPPAPPRPEPAVTAVRAPARAPEPAAAARAAPERTVESAAAAHAPVERRRSPRPDAPNWEPLGSPAATGADRFSFGGPATEPPAEAGQGPSFDTLFVVPKPGTDEDGGFMDDARDDARAEAPADADASGEPSFLRAHEAQPPRAVRAALAGACALLLPLLLAQLLLIARAPLIVAFPSLRPALQALCAPLGCTASWPMRPDLLAVVSSELQAVPGTDALELDTVLRNRAAFPLALPAVELTISDSIGHAVVRKVFLPADYLGSTLEGDPAAGNIPAGADLAVRVAFSLPGVNAAGFEAYPFYP
jgi:predicted Zn finger-like uncharacterized protein